MGHWYPPYQLSDFVIQILLSDSVILLFCDSVIRFCYSIIQILLFNYQIL